MESNNNLLASVTLFDPVISEFRLGFDEKYQKKLVDESQTEKLEEIVERKIPTFNPPPQITELPQTGILEDLNQTIILALEDYRKSTIKRFSEDHATTNMIRRDVEDFYDSRVKYWASEILKLLEGLVRFDGYPQEMFANFQTLKKTVDLSDGEKSSESLRELIICAKSIIPPSIRYVPEVIIESNNSFSDITEG